MRFMQEESVLIVRDRGSHKIYSWVLKGCPAPCVFCKGRVLAANQSAFGNYFGPGFRRVFVIFELLFSHSSRSWHRMYQSLTSSSMNPIIWCDSPTSGPGRCFDVGQNWQMALTPAPCKKRKERGTLVNPGPGKSWVSRCYCISRHAPYAQTTGTAKSMASMRSSMPP